MSYEIYNTFTCSYFFYNSTFYRAPSIRACLSPHQSHAHSSLMAALLGKSLLQLWIVLKQTDSQVEQTMKLIRIHLIWNTHSSQKPQWKREMIEWLFDWQLALKKRKEFQVIISGTKRRTSWFLIENACAEIGFAASRKQRLILQPLSVGTSNKFQISCLSRRRLLLTPFLQRRPPLTLS